MDSQETELTLVGSGVQRFRGSRVQGFETEMRIRPEVFEDKSSIHDVNVKAFEGPAEANLVDVLRGRATPFISLVAEEEDNVISHICFTPIVLKSDPACRAVGLAPMAVRPGWQKRGIGTQFMVRRGLRDADGAGQDFVVVVGHSHYYPRFGFEQAVAKGLKCQFPHTDDVFMVLELRPGSLAGREGLVRYHPAFSESSRSQNLPPAMIENPRFLIFTPSARSRCPRLSDPADTARRSRSGGRC